MKPKAGVIVLSDRELDRLEYLRRVSERRLSQKKAAEILGLSTRQLRRLQSRLEAQGPRGLSSRSRGRPGNRRHPEAVRKLVLELVRERYADFGPTLAREKLSEIHGISVGKETLRRWLVAAGIWVPRAKRQRIHQPRPRRECFGELVQIDGSPHDWLEGRGRKCTLLVFIDDATGRLMTLRFVESETTFGYFEATRDYLTHYGKPVAFYSDKHTIFRSPLPARGQDLTAQTQFGRALAELNIDIICANTPQAKGRVERANRTLQDRLVKELRLRGISNIEAANAFALEFMEDFNRRFAKAPLNPHDAHRPVRKDEDLERILVKQLQRTISKDLVVHYDRKKYIIEPTADTLRYAKKTCIVHEWPDGKVEIRAAGRSLPYRMLDKVARVSRTAIVENKLLGEVLEQIRKDQDTRDERRLAQRQVSLRKKARIRASQKV